MKFQQLHTQRKFIIVGTTLGVIGLLPFLFNYGTESVNSMKSVSILALILFILSGVIAQAGNEKTIISKKVWLPVLGAGVINICIIGYLIIWGKSAMSGVTEKGIAMNRNAGSGLGIWIAIAGAALIVYGAYKYRSAGNNLKDS